jgi:hypothetical protein
VLACLDVYDPGDVLRRRLGAGRTSVGPVHVETGQHLPDGPGEVLAGVVAMAAVALADADQEVGEPVDVGGQHLPHDEVLVGVDQGEVRRRPVDHGGVDLVQRALAGRVHEQAADAGGEVVAGGAVHRPTRGQGLVGLQDLLDHQVGVGSGAVADELEVRRRLP